MCNQIEINKVREYNIIIDKNNTDVNSLHKENKYSNDSTDNAKDSNTTVNNEQDPSLILKEIEAKNENRIVVAHHNINYIYQNCEALKTLVDNNVDILMISETKIDESFPSKQFQIEGFSPPLRLDRNKFGGGILFMFVRIYHVKN